MASTEISFKQASELIKKHGPHFGGEGVVGVGIEGRGNGLRFIVAVTDEKTRNKLAKQYEKVRVHGYPVLVEQRSVTPMAGSVSSTPEVDRVTIRRPVWQEIADRPGYLVLGGVLALVLAMVWAF